MLVFFAVGSCFSNTQSVEYNSPLVSGEVNSSPSSNINYVWNQGSCCDGVVDVPPGCFDEAIRLPYADEFNFDRATTPTGEIFGNYDLAIIVFFSIKTKSFTFHSPLYIYRTKTTIRVFIEENTPD